MPEPKKPVPPPVALKRKKDGVLKSYPADTVAALLATGEYVKPTDRDLTAKDLAKATATEGEEKHGGLGGAVSAGATSFARTASLGLVDVDNPAEAYHPYVSTGAAILGAVVDPTHGVATVDRAGAYLGTKAANALRLGESSAIRAGLDLGGQVLLGDAAMEASAVLHGDRSLADAALNTVWNKNAAAFGTFAMVATRARNRKLASAAAVRGFADTAAGRVADAEKSAADVVANVDARKAELNAVKDPQGIRDQRASYEAAQAENIPSLDPELYGVAEVAINGGKKRVNVSQDLGAVRGRLQGLERQAEQAPERMSAWERERGRFDAAEAARVDPATSVAYHEKANAEHANLLKAKRESLFGDFQKELALDPAAASLHPALIADRFENWLVQKGQGAYTREGQAQGHLADAFMRKIDELGENIPTSEAEFTRLFDDVAAENGYKPNGQVAKRKKVETNHVDDQHRGYLPESGLRPLTDAESSLTYELSAEIGQAGKRKMVFSADEARQLSTGRQVEILSSLQGRKAKETFLGLMSPTTRFAVMAKATGRVAYGDALTLQKHLLDSAPYSERAARTRFELAESLKQSYVLDDVARVRPSVDIAPPPRDIAPPGSGYTEGPREFPIAPPRADFADEIASIKGEFDALTVSKQSLENLKLPKNAKEFLGQSDARIDQFSMAARLAKESPHPAVAELGRAAEHHLDKLLTAAGIDYAGMGLDAFDGVKAYKQTWLAAKGAKSENVAATASAYRAAKEAQQQAVQAAQEALRETNKGLKGGKGAMKAAEKANMEGARELGLVTSRGSGRLPPMKEAAVIASRYGGSKIGAMLGNAFGTLTSIGGFAAGGAILAAKMDNFLRGGKAVEKIMAHDAMLALAKRRETMAKIYDTVLTLATPLAFKRVGKPIEAIFRDDRDNLLDLFPEDDQPDEKLSDAELLQEYHKRNAPAFLDPQSHAYEQVKPFIHTQPEFARVAAESIAARIEALKKSIPPTPYYGYVSNAPIRMSGSLLEKAKRVVDTVQNPDRVLSGMISNANFPMEELNILRNTNPDMVMEAVVEVSNRLFTQDEAGNTLFSKLSSSQKRQFSRFIGQEMDPADSPRYVAAMQQMHQEQQQPKENASQSLRGPRGAPIAPMEDTESQKSTYR